QILPGDVTIHEGERVNFAAVALDKDNNPVGGVTFNWTARDEDHNLATRISPRGKFEAAVSGNYKVTVARNGRQTRVKVKVLEGDRRRNRDKKPTGVITVSNRDDAPGSSSYVSPQNRRGRKAAHATRSMVSPVPPVLCPPDDTWNDCNWRSSSDPGNRR